MIYKFDELVIDSRTGLNPRKNFKLGKGNNNYITIKDIQNGRIVISDKTDKIDDDAIRIIKKRSRIKNGDILFSSIGRVGDTAIVTNKDDSWDVNESVFIFTINKKLITPEYFCHLIGSQATKDKLNKNSTGSTFKSVKMGQLNKMMFVIPSMQKQKIISDQLRNLKQLMEMRAKQLSEYDLLIKSRFVEMFGDPASNTKNYRMVNLSDIAQYFNGLTYSPENVSDEGIIVLRSSNIQNSKLDFKDIIRVQLNVKDNKIVRENDILMCSRNGSAKLVGKVALIDNLPEKMAFGAFMMIIRSEYHAYLMSYFQMDAFRRQIATGATTTINQITSRMLNNVKLPLPEKNKVREFELLVKKVDKLKFEVQKSLDETQMLFDSLMQEYFGY